MTSERTASGPRVRHVLTGAFHDFGRAWRELLATDVLYKVLAFGILTPLVGIALRAFVSTSGNSVLADTDILLFFLSPVGLLALVVLSALSLAIVALEQACLMTIGFGAVLGQRVGYSDALLYGARRAGAVLRLTVRATVYVLLLSAPVLVAGGLVYAGLLTEFDINYYLAERPQAFWLAASILGVLLVVLAAVLLPLLAGWALALPLLLFEGVDARQALSASRERVRGHRWTIGVTLLGLAWGASLLSGLTLAVVRIVGGWILPALTGSLSVLVVATGGLLLLWGAANLVASLVTVSAFALVMVRLFDHFKSPQKVDLPWASSWQPFGERRGWTLSMKALSLALAAIALIGGMVGVFFVDGIRIDRDVLVTAHRGAAGAAPENTLASVERALADGADMIEIDVQETADGEVVVIHDSDLMKIGSVNLAIWDATYPQLQGIDVGSWFAPEFSGERVPKLRQVLELCKGRARVDIELKYYGHDVRLEERVVEIVEASGMESEVVVMSLKYEGIQKLRELRPDWTVGLLTATALGDLTRLDADFLAVHANLATPHFIRRAHRRGKEVFVWTINDPSQMSRMISRGVDSLITDQPALARAVIQERAEMNVVERLLLELSLWLGAESSQPGPETDAG